MPFRTSSSNRQTGLEILRGATTRPPPAASGRSSRATPAGSRTAWRKTLTRKQRRRSSTGLGRHELCSTGSRPGRSPGSSDDGRRALRARPGRCSTVAVKDGGPAVPGRSFVRPPTSEEHLVDPWTFLEDDSVPRGVEAAGAAPGEKKTARGHVGDAGWLFTLGERRSRPRQTLTRPTAGTATRYVAYDPRRASDCVRVNYRARRRRDLQEMAASLGRLGPGRPRATRGRPRT